MNELVHADRDKFPALARYVESFSSLEKDIAMAMWGEHNYTSDLIRNKLWNELNYMAQLRWLRRARIALYTIKQSGLTITKE